ncbi:hypothetical protein GIB67_028439 [Kingdonia uniflora]|uniref:Uncharacterized protein n=1 Tax=Kingdonia uniflora TaxID=39325 RepID=A0A7J7P139_9MAGN|nr:hypothetical protein GIB67_028439 [Kingdonia uniflora]
MILTWHKVKPNVKDRLWEMVKQTFIVPEEARKLTLLSIGKDWRKFKVEKRKLIDINDEYEQALEKCLEDVPYNQWEVFAKQCTSSNYKNKEIADDATSVVKKDKIDEINSNNPDVGDDDLTEVLGPEYPGCMRATGFGISPTLYKGVKHGGLIVQSLQEEVRVLREELVVCKEVNEKVSSLEAQMTEMTKLLEMLKMKLPLEKVASRVYSASLGDEMSKASIQTVVKEDMPLSGGEHETIGDHIAIVAVAGVHALFIFYRSSKFRSCAARIIPTPYASLRFEGKLLIQILGKPMIQLVHESIDQNVLDQFIEVYKQVAIGDPLEKVPLLFNAFEKIYITLIYCWMISPANFRLHDSDCGIVNANIPTSGTEIWRRFWWGKGYWWWSRSGK